MKSPQILKARRIEGAHLVLRNVVIADAAFILQLRTDPVKGNHLSATSSRLEDQEAWLRQYAESAGQAYFLVCDQQQRSLGCVRMYGAEGDSFSWGSWLMISGLSPAVAIESVLLVYAYARALGFAEARIDVRRSNQSVRNFHSRFFGAVEVGESGEDIHYVMDTTKIDAALARFHALLTHPLRIEPLEDAA